MLAVIRSETKDVDGAIAEYQALIKQSPNNPLSHHHLGHQWISKAEWRRSADCFRRAIDLDPSYASAHAGLAAALRNANELSEAEASIREAIRLEPTNAYYYQWLAKYLQFRKEYAAARDAIDRACSLAPNNSSIQYTLGGILVRMNDIEGALAAYRKSVELDPKSYFALRDLARVLRRKKDYESATQVYNSATDAHPNYQPLRDEILSFRLKPRDSDKSWEENLNRIEDIQDAIYRAPEDLDLRFQLLLAYRQADFQSSAILACREILARKKDHWDAHYHMGQCLHQSRQFNEAIKAFQECVRLQPDKAEAHSHLAASLLIIGDKEGALKAATRSLAMNPRLAHAHETQGKVYLDTHRNVEAEAAFLRALACDANRGYSYYGLGNAQMNQGRFVEAHQSLGRAVRLVPTSDSSWIQVYRLENQARRYVTVQGKLPALLAGRERTEDWQQAYDLGHLCAVYLGDHAEAVRFFVEAFAFGPPYPHKFFTEAAASALLSSNEMGQNAGRLSTERKKELRELSHEWLMLACEQFKKDRSPSVTPLMQTEVRQWLTGEPFASVREQTALVKMPAEERKKWEELWNQVRQLEAVLKKY